MPTKRWDASALCMQDGPEAVLVVGGCNSSSSEAPRRCAELLTHTAGASGGGGAWRWRKLNEMHEGREYRPGMLLLPAGCDRQRVLVAGGNSRTAEILQLSCSDPSDCGQWTRIAGLSEGFDSTSLVQCSISRRRGGVAMAKAEQNARESQCSARYAAAVRWPQAARARCWRGK